MKMKTALGSLAACLVLGAMADDASINSVSIRQRWPWSRLVDIDYVLACDSTQRVDMTVNAYDGDTQLTLPAVSLTGDISGVMRGAHRIVWDPTATAYTNSGVLTKFRVQLTPTPVPLYMIVDLTKAAGADGQIEYIYSGDARLETYGRFTNVWFGVTNDSVYATDKLVLRRISAGTFGMGDNATLSTTLTKEFYAGVFEVTQRQWELIMGTNPSRFKNSTYYATRPVEYVSYDDIRGATNSVPAVNWPLTDRTVVTANSFLGKLRAKTGLTDFDLPTEAQSVCACRAGTTTVFNDGNATANVSGANAGTNAWLDALGRYAFNGGLLADGVTAPASDCGPTNGTAVVGSYRANAWGLYDMQGNVGELCLDWHASSLTCGSDPSGAVSGSRRVKLAGGAADPASWCRATTRFSAAPPDKGWSLGLRLVRTLP